MRAAVYEARLVREYRYKRESEGSVHAPHVVAHVEPSPAEAGELRCAARATLMSKALRFLKQAERGVGRGRRARQHISACAIASATSNARPTSVMDAPCSGGTTARLNSVVNCLPDNA